MRHEAAPPSAFGVCVLYEDRLLGHDEATCSLRCCRMRRWAAPRPWSRFIRKLPRVPLLRVGPGALADPYDGAFQLVMPSSGEAKRLTDGPEPPWDGDLLLGLIRGGGPSG